MKLKTLFNSWKNQENVSTNTTEQELQARIKDLEKQLKEYQEFEKELDENWDAFYKSLNQTNEEEPIQENDSAKAVKEILTNGNL